MTVLVAAQGVRFWKRDLSRAFRRIPLWHRHLELASALWKENGQFRKAQHRAMPMGTIAAVVAWHVVCGLVVCYLRRVLKRPCGRYVDDLFGTGRSGVRWTAARALGVVSVLLGLPAEHSKDGTDLISMVVLGMRLALSPCRRSVQLVTEEENVFDGSIFCRRFSTLAGATPFVLARWQADYVGA